MLRAVIGCFSLACALSAAATARQELGDERLRKAWSYLLPAEQDEALARFEGEVSGLPTLQNRLLRHVSRLAELDIGMAPVDQPAPYFDPKVHAPAQPIPRRTLDPQSKDAQDQRASMLTEIAGEFALARCRYDWGQRLVLRAASFDDLDRRMESALAGRAPGFDWARAWVERALDGGAHQATFAAFGHAYTDRAGNVYAGVTLYDAWSSGAKMEMPDVDALGLVHELLGDWKRWVAPVPAIEHDRLYASVGKLFVPAHRYRALREALARTFVEGTVPLRDGFGAQIDRLHALWEACLSQPLDLAARLPADAETSEFLAKWTLECEEDAKVRDAGKQRRATLDADSQQVRALWASILTDLGALDRKSRPSERAPEGK